MQAFIDAFFSDTRVQILFLAIIGRLAFGVIAALVDKKQAFRLSFVADILRVDVLGKVLPFLLLYAGYKYAGNEELVIPFLDLDVVMNGAWGIIMIALGGAILASLKDLGLLGSERLPDVVAGPDPTTPTPIAPS